MTPYRLHNASVGYDGRAVLRDVQIDIRPGERVGLIGRSGAGKSTLINYAYNTYPDDSALIPQALGLVDSLSAFQMSTWAGWIATARFTTCSTLRAPAVVR